jgi:hypothetical protein
MTKFKFDKYNICWKTTFSYINLKESRSDNQQWTIQIYWHWVHKAYHEDPEKQGVKPSAREE